MLSGSAVAGYSPHFYAVVVVARFKVKLLIKKGKHFNNCYKNLPPQ